jgi:hypothetical protein
MSADEFVKLITIDLSFNILLFCFWREGAACKKWFLSWFNVEGGYQTLG